MDVMRTRIWYTLQGIGHKENEINYHTKNIEDE